MSRSGSHRKLASPGTVSGAPHLTAVPELAPIAEPLPEQAPIVKPSRNVSRGIRPVQTTWKTLVSVCKKCGGRPKNLQSELRKIYKNREIRDLRVVRTTCLNVCPKNGTCWSLATENDVKTYIVTHEVPAEDIAAFIDERIGQSSSAPKA